MSMRLLQTGLQFDCIPTAFDFWGLVCREALWIVHNSPLLPATAWLPSDPLRPLKPGDAARGWTRVGADPRPALPRFGHFVVAARFFPLRRSGVWGWGLGVGFWGLGSVRAGLGSGSGGRWLGIGRQILTCDRSAWNLAFLSGPWQAAEKRKFPVIQSSAKDLNLFVFKEIIQMLRCAQHDNRLFRILLEPCPEPSPQNRAPRTQPLAPGT